MPDAYVPRHIGEEFLPHKEVYERDGDDEHYHCRQKGTLLAGGGRVHQDAANPKKVGVCCGAGQIGVQDFGNDDDVPPLGKGQERAGD